MTRKEEMERNEFADVLSEAAGRSAVREADLICRHGRTYARIQEMWCNEEMSERRTKEVEHKEALLERRITELATACNCKADFAGDPRGATVKIILPNGRTNDWAKEGWCVPTA